VDVLRLIGEIVVCGILALVAIAIAIIGSLTLVGTWLSYRANRHGRIIPN
jgi:hypothetical protein